MKRNISLIFKEFYRNTVRWLLSFVLLIAISFAIILTLTAIKQTRNKALAFIEKNRTYFIGLILTENYESIHSFLIEQNKKIGGLQFSFKQNIDQHNKNGNAVNLKIGKDIYGQIFYKINYFEIMPWLPILLILFITCVFIALSNLLYNRMTKFIDINIIDPLTALSESIQVSQNLIDLSNFTGDPGQTHEINLIQKTLVQFGKRIVESEIERAKSKIANQVAHDIRSPLSALEMASSQINYLPEDIRVLIRNAINRIKDIANSLSEVKHSESLRLDGKSSITLEKVLLAPLIESIITEKRMQYRARSQIQISFNQTRESYGLFSNINIIEFKRIISNLINNGIEAISNRGHVEIALYSLKDHIRIDISDNGIGIKEEILNKLGAPGMTYGKAGGSGLGLSHAKEKINLFKGNLSLVSSFGAGTTVQLSLPKEATPDWFVPELQVKQGQKIVIFDDDQTIHQIWQGRFESSLNSDPSSYLVHISSSADFRRYFRDSFFTDDEHIFLVDYEIVGDTASGLDLIIELGLQTRSILVTSRYEELEIRRRCEKFKIKLIPKSMSGFIPITIR